MSNIAAQLEYLMHIAANPKQQLEKHIQAGKKVVGCLPVYCPEELVHAANMVPFGIWGAQCEIAQAKKYFPAFMCSIAQTSLEMGLRGELNALSAVLIPVLCDTLKCLGQNWKAGVSQVPFIQVTHPQNRKLPAGKVFLAKQYQGIAQQLATISGEPFDENRLKTSIAVYNEHRAVMRAFNRTAATYPHLISPQQRNAVIKSAFFLQKEEHTRLVQQLINECNTQPVQPWSGTKVVVSGIVADSPALLNLFAEYGMAVVADDVAQESRQFRVDVPADNDPFMAMARQLADMNGCSVLYDAEKQRGPMIVDMAKENNAQGVVVLLTKFCDPEEFDWPSLKQAFDHAGLPSIMIEVDLQMRNYEQARTALQTFSHMLTY